jgi:nucleoside 2-deoxyribosyltransferase
MELCRGVYLAGPMAGLEARDMKEWRGYAQKRLLEADIKVLDPTRRISYHEQSLNDRGLDRNIANRIFKQDLRDIARSEVLLVDMRDIPGVKGQGTAAEVMFAHMKNKVIIMWVPPIDTLNPFMTAMATEVHETLDEAVEACIEHAG